MSRILHLNPLDPLWLGLAFAFAFGLSVVLTPFVGRLASSIGAVAKPRQDRWHRKPTPLLGGIAIYAASVLAILAFAPLDLRTLGILAGGTALFVTGLVDDVRHLRPQTKLIVQILAASGVVAAGVRIESVALATVAIPLTIVWIVGITNAFNLLDNMDGLSAGTAVIASLFLLGFSLSVGNASTAILCLAIAGGALGFLIYNFNPARIFMGDTGSMFLGFMLSGVALLGTREMASDIFFVLLVPVAMMGLPIFDTTLVSIMRTIEGRPLSQGGRDHLSHRLVALGLSERQAVLLLYLLGAGFGSLGLIARSVGAWPSVVVAVALLAATVLFGAYLAQVRIYAPSQFEKAVRTTALADRPVVNGMIMFKRELGMIALDFSLICIAYLAAYLIKYGMHGATIPPAIHELAPVPDVFSQSLPFVVLVQLGALFVFQSYRGMLRYVGLSELLDLGKATGSSLVILLLLLPRILPDPAVPPKTVMVIDAMVVTALLMASRVSFSALTETFARLQRQRVPSILIVGAGDLGELVLRSVLRSRPTAYQAVGFLDPDAGRRNRSIHGVRVLGGIEDFDDVLAERDVDMVVLALPAASVDSTMALKQRCEELELPWYQAAAFVEMHFTGALRTAEEEDEIPSPPRLLN